MNRSAELPHDYQPQRGLLRDRVILITGAGSGIGRTVALSFAQHQATVILLGKTISKLEQVYDEILAMGAPQPAIYPLNLENSNPHEYQQLAGILDHEFGRLDGLLLNAAWLGALTPMAHYDATLWNRVLQINLQANFLLTQHCYPVLCKSADARIVFTSDACAVNGKAYWGAYAVAKAGGDALMRLLASEWENHTSIRVNSLDPGAVQTALRRQAYPGEDARALPTAESLLPAYLYLFGPDSRVATGQRFVWTNRSRQDHA